jgi:diguanylate cyclase
MSGGVVRLNQNAVTARIVWPVAFILLSVVVVLYGVLSWSSSRANSSAIERQKTELTDILDRERSNVLLRLARVMTSADVVAALRHPMDPAIARRTIGDALTVGFKFDDAFVVTPEGLVVTGTPAVDASDQSRFDRQLRTLAPVIASVRDRVAQLALRRDDHVSSATADPFLVARSGQARLLATPEGPRIVAALALPGTEADDSVFGGMVAIASRALTQAALDDLGLSPRFRDLHVVAGDAAQDAAAIPLLDSTGATAGALAWTPEQPGGLVLTLLVPSTVLALAGILLFSCFLFVRVRRITTDLMAREAVATHQSLHDDLSGLPNRVFFTERLDAELLKLERGTEPGEGLAVFYLDLDRFKDINDLHGHDAGDELIVTVAKRLSSALRGTDTLARFGGDEFAVIQSGVHGPHDCASLAHRLLDALRMPFNLDGRQIYVGISIGIAVAPQNGRDRAQLMKFADVALYRAKHEGRNRYAFFEIGMDATLRLRKLVEEELREAIAADQLEIAYQPQFSADGRNIMGVEALVRWNHPVHGMISPADFVPIAEERGLISMLGEWVLRRACRDGRRWTGISVAVNVSPIQFRQKDFVGTVSRIVAEEGMDATRVELELTEGVIVEDADAAESAMMDLRAEGFRFALDDFGTGYSSLIYLRRFAFDKIKIDRSFLESMETTGESAILVHSVVHLGRALGLTVTAEGVETAEQQRFLQAVGCHQLQGYLFCKPVPAWKIDELLGLVGDTHIAAQVA